MQFVDPDRIEQSDHVQAASFAPVFFLSLSITANREQATVLESEMPSLVNGKLKSEALDTEKLAVMLKSSSSPLASQLASLCQALHSSACH